MTFIDDAKTGGVAHVFVSHPSSAVIKVVYRSERRTDLETIVLVELFGRLLALRKLLYLGLLKVVLLAAVHVFRAGVQLKHFVVKV